MERNRWATALRCLEVALHPNTSDDEVLAGVNGFRRTAGRTPLTEICAEFARDGSHVADLAEWTARFVRLSRENQELRRRLDSAEAKPIATLAKIDDSQQRLRDLAEQLLAAEGRANLAEHRLVDARDAYAQVTEGLRHEIAGLRATVEHARNTAQRAAAEPAPLFSDFLSAAQQGADRPQFTQRTAAAPMSGPAPRSPWTA
jgi:chromosome segregation ATPase